MNRNEEAVTESGIANELAIESSRLEMLGVEEALKQSNGTVSMGSVDEGVPDGSALAIRMLLSCASPLRSMLSSNEDVDGEGIYTALYEEGGVISTLDRCRMM